VDDEVYTLPEIPGARTEVERIAAMITEGQRAGAIRCSVDVRHDVTCEGMSELVQGGGYDVIHYSGHAIHTDSPESSSLFFWQDDRSHNDPIGMLTTNQLNFIVERTKLKFFYLSCCQGASAGASDKLRNNDFLGITHALLVGGVPAVLAMRWPLNDRTATFLASSFYSEMFKGAGIELSLFRARRRLQSRWPNDHSWLSPVLIVQT
jgi:CHAT domain-containing protein